MASSSAVDPNEVNAMNERPAEPPERETQTPLEQLSASVDRRFDAVDQRFEAVDRRFDAVDQRFEAVDRRFDAVDRRFDALDDAIVEQRQYMEFAFDTLKQDMMARFERIDQDMGVVNTRLGGLEQEVGGLKQ